MLQVTVRTGTGEHPPVVIEDGFVPGVVDPTPLQVLTEFTKTLLLESDAVGTVQSHGFRVPLSITVEDV